VFDVGCWDGLPYCSLDDCPCEPTELCYDDSYACPGFCPSEDLCEIDQACNTGDPLPCIFKSQSTCLYVNNCAITAEANLNTCQTQYSIDGFSDYTCPEGYTCYGDCISAGMANTWDPATYPAEDIVGWLNPFDIPTVCWDGACVLDESECSDSPCADGEVYRWDGSCAPEGECPEVTMTHCGNPESQL
jgi:hypothetical protein